jgi:hypothetical protein
MKTETLAIQLRDVGAITREAVEEAVFQAEPIQTEPQSQIGSGAALEAVFEPIHLLSLDIPTIYGIPALAAPQQLGHFPFQVAASAFQSKSVWSTSRLTVLVQALGGLGGLERSAFEDMAHSFYRVQIKLLFPSHFCCTDELSKLSFISFFKQH